MKIYHVTASNREVGTYHIGNFEAHTQFVATAKAIDAWKVKIADSPLRAVTWTYHTECTGASNLE